MPTQELQRRPVAQSQLHVLSEPAARRDRRPSRPTRSAPTRSASTARATQNANYMLDGAGNNDNFNNGNGGAQARTPVEAVQEFQLLTSNFDAEFGSTSGGVVNAVSKQGTNNAARHAVLLRAEPVDDVAGLLRQAGEPDKARSRAEAVGRQPRRTDHQEQAALLRQPRADRSEPRADDEHRRAAGSELRRRSRTTTSGTGWSASTTRSTRTTRGRSAGCARRRRRPISSCRPTTRCSAPRKSRTRTGRSSAR